MEGWAWLTNVTKRHYFVNGRSLCKQWVRLGELELLTKYDDIQENCKRCMEILKKRKNTEGKKAA